MRRMWHVWEKDKCIQKLWGEGEPKGKKPLEDVRVDGKVILKMDFQEIECDAWNGFSSGQGQMKAVGKGVINFQIQ